ncbi:MAG: hypothetical protein VR70_14370 [Rhodospirillaceae bacterium BRH_c57]|nr:MAG: hypothetical protein VR70_14370 [Rhodospirillaceae bacterium BRH_c57]
MREAAAFGVLVAMIAGFLLWTSAFVALYAVFSLACVHDWPMPRLLVVGAWLVHVAGHGALVAWTLRWWRVRPTDPTGSRPFLRLAAVTIAIAALGATVWTGLPVVLTFGCS